LSCDHGTNFRLQPTFLWATRSCHKSNLPVPTTKGSFFTTLWVEPVSDSRKYSITLCSSPFPAPPITRSRDVRTYLQYNTIQYNYRERQRTKFLRMPGDTMLFSSVCPNFSRFLVIRFCSRSGDFALCTDLGVYKRQIMFKTPEETTYGNIMSGVLQPRSGALKSIFLRTNKQASPTNVQCVLKFLRGTIPAQLRRGTEEPRLKTEEVGDSFLRRVH
jgi:hypothetical protein